MKANTNDLIVGTIQNYNWPQVRSYAVSLARTSYAGTKILFVKNITQEAESNLLSLGFRLLHFDNYERFIECGRFAPVVAYLGEHYKEFRYVVWTDVGDVVFQSDPTVWLENNLAPHRLAAAKECWKIKDEDWNNLWASQALSSDNYNQLKEEEACCGGTLAGTSGTMNSILFLLYRMVSVNQMANDQGILNYLLRMPPYKEIVKIPRMDEGFAIMCAAFHTSTFSSYVNPRIPLTDNAPIFDRNSGTVLNPDGHNPFCIVHQYNRDSSWKSIIEEKYQ